MESRVVQLQRTLNGRMKGLHLMDSEEQLKVCVPGRATCRLGQSRRSPGVGGAWVAVGIPHSEEDRLALWVGGQQECSISDRGEGHFRGLCTATDWTRSQGKGKRQRWTLWSQEGQVWKVAGSWGRRKVMGKKLFCVVGAEFCFGHTELKVPAECLGGNVQCVMANGVRPSAERFRSNMHIHGTSA